MNPINRHTAEELLEKYEKGLCTEEELAVLESWYLQYEHEPLPPLDADQMGIIAASTAPYVTVHRMWPKMVAAAVTIAAIAVGAYFFAYQPAPDAVVTDNKESTKIVPGKVGATLTMANGKTIHLSEAREGELAAENGITVRKSATGELVYEDRGQTGAPGQFNTLSTANGQRYLVSLPDKSKVWLNAASSIKYSNALASADIREVELKGEAYFEIRQDPNRPFIVKSQHQQLEVLGTHFNVKAYPTDDQIHSTLLEGSVRINGSTLLAPGEMAINSKGTIRSVKVDTSLIVAWVKNDFYFNNARTEDVMKDMARRYDIQIAYASEDIKNIPISGHLSKDRSLSTVLERMGAAAHLHFNVSGNKVTVERQLE